MEKIDLTTALSRLLCDADLRQSFALARRETASRMGVGDEDTEAFVALDECALEAQARTLLSKRFHEVAALLPATIKQLGAEAEEIFNYYAPTHWPQGHRRHADDADAFCRFLSANGLSVCKAEQNRIAFGAAPKRLAIHAVRDLPVKGRPKYAIQFLYKTRRGPRQFSLYMDF